MNEQQRLDRVIGEKLRHRSFPQDPTYLNEVRAMIDARNGKRSAENGFRKGFLLGVLIPLGGMLLWWGTNSTSRPEVAVNDQRTERRADSAVASARPLDAEPSSPAQIPVAHGNERTFESDAAHGTGPSAPTRMPDHREHATTSRVAQQGSQAPTLSVPLEHAMSASAETRASEASALRSRTSAEHTMEQIAGLVGGINMLHPSPLKLDASDLNTEPWAGNAIVATGHDEDGYNALAWNADQPLSPLACRHDAVQQWSREQAVAPSPLAAPSLDKSAYRNRAAGQLHAFGGWLATRTDLPNASARASSLYGLEYATRFKRFTLATGVHYGSYGVAFHEAEHAPGASTLRLEYVEVPLLVGYKFGHRRLAVSLQAGLCLDMLFSASGRYQTDANGPQRVIPDDVLRNTNYAVLLRPRLSYQATDLLSLQLGPLFKQQLASVALQGPLADARTQSAGVCFGATWNLQRSAF